MTEEQQWAIKDLGKTYVTFDKLRREGRDSVWAYVARNLSRPLAYSAAGGWAHVIVGNPPWVAYRHMSPDLQTRFKELAKGELVYVGGKFATQNDLCALFTVRATMLYLRSGGRLGLVLPHGRADARPIRPVARRLVPHVADRLGRGLGHERRCSTAVSGAVLRRLRRAAPLTSKPLPDTVRVYSGNFAAARRAGGNRRSACLR